MKKFGRDKFLNLLDKSENQAEYRLLSLQSRFDLTQDDQRVEFLKESAQLISTFSTAVERDVYAARAAEAAGITTEAMKLEVSRAYQRRMKAEKKKKEQTDLNILRQVQPRERSLRYDNAASAVAEEILLAQVLKEPGLLSEVRLPEEAFSSPLLGKAFGLVRQQVEDCRPVTLASLSGSFTPEEMNHLTMVVKNRDQLVSDTVVRDCAARIRDEYEKHLRTGSKTDSQDLLARWSRLREKNGLGG